MLHVIDVLTAKKALRNKNMTRTQCTAVSSTYFDKLRMCVHEARTPVLVTCFLRKSNTRHSDRLWKRLSPFQRDEGHAFMRLTINSQSMKLSCHFDGLLELAGTCQACGLSSLTTGRYQVRGSRPRVCMNHVITR